MNAQTKIRYPTKAAIARAIEAPKECDLKVSGFEVCPDGTVRILGGGNAPVDSAYDRWQATR